MSRDKKTASEKAPEEKLSRNFTHITIPAEIWLRKDISIQGKCLWAEIRSLHSNDQGGCYASDEYLMEFMQVQRRRLYILYKELKDANLLEIVSFNGRRTIRKAIVPEVNYGSAHQECTKVHSRSAENCISDVQDTALPSYIENKAYKKDNIVATDVALSADADDLLSFFIKKLKERKPDIKLPDRKSWLVEIDRMIRIDNRDPKKIKAMIDWIHRDSFWSTTILSPRSLRAQYDRIELQALGKSEKTTIVQNRDYAMRHAKKYPESYKNLIIAESYIINQGTGKELPLKLNHETFKKSFMSTFGINWNDLSENDKK